MFELIRERKKLLLVLLLLLVVPPFVVVGAWDRINPATGIIVATVNGKDIFQREWEVAHQQLIDEFKQRIGQDLPEEVFNSQSAREVTLDDMINREIIKVVTQDLSIHVSDEAVKSVISSIPQFQTDGIFDLKKAQNLLEQRGTRADLFESGVRSDLALRTIPSAISGTAFVPRSVARRMAQAENEDRLIRVKFFSSLSYENDGSITDEDIENFYNLNKNMFQVPARYDLEFIIVEESDQLEEIANSVYEESESLNPTADSFNLKLRNVNGFRFGQLLVDSSLKDKELDALNSPKFRTALRNAEVIEEGKNTDLLEINPKLNISARIIKKYESKPIPFQVVKPQIGSDLKLKKMAAAANEAAGEWIKLYSSADEQERNNLLAELSETMTINRLDPSANLGKYKNALTGKTDEIFDHDFAVREMKKLDLGGNGSLVIFLETSYIPKPSSSSVTDSLPKMYSNLENVDSQVSYSSWLNQTQLGMDVERYSERLVSPSSVSSE
ncbi:MAG: hypothetical protein CBC01_01505 [Betaproteobacteria bacterium TMED41]|nr:MAG: hypothetical protein CBC01_01505 [Betaproteobacteria bacterium TMED41]